MISNFAVNEGTTANDEIIASDLHDTIRADSGNDIIHGKKGNDTIYGGEGSDTYIFNLGDGSDKIIETASSESDIDEINFQSGISADSLWFSQKENNLLINLLETEDSIEVQDWFVSNEAKIEKLSLDNGLEIDSVNINLLVDAMSSFAPPVQGEVVLTAEEQNQINQIVTSHWQAT